MPHSETCSCDVQIVHAFPGQGDFSVTPVLNAISSAPGLRVALEEVFALADPVAAEFDVHPVGSRLLGGASISSRALAAETPGTSQLALFGVCLAVHKALASSGRQADAILAVSFGEIPALVAAGACSVPDGARLACLLGKLLARRPGGLMLLRADERKTTQMLRATGTHSTVIACVNDSTETLVSGPAAEIGLIEKRAFRAGITTHRLRLPFIAHHPALGREAGEFAHFARRLRLSPVRVPFYSAVAGQAYTAETDLARALSACLVRPVALPPVLRQITARASIVLEAGTGDALTRSIRRNIPGLMAQAPIAEDTYPWEGTSALPDAFPSPPPSAHPA